MDAISGIDLTETSTPSSPSVSSPVSFDTPSSSGMPIPPRHPVKVQVAVNAQAPCLCHQHPQVPSHPHDHTHSRSLSAHAWEASAQAQNARTTARPVWTSLPPTVPWRSVSVRTPSACSPRPHPTPALACLCSVLAPTMAAQPRSHASAVHSVCAHAHAHGTPALALGQDLARAAPQAHDTTRTSRYLASHSHRAECVRIDGGGPCSNPNDRAACKRAPVDHSVCMLRRSGRRCAMCA